MKISLSILNADFSNLYNDLKEIINDVDMIHMDVMDGVFVPNLSFGPDIIKSLRPKTNIPFDTHLMIAHPLKYLDDYIKAGSDLITVHYEIEDDLKAIINYLKNKNIKVGISIKPDTKVEVLDPYLSDLDLILIMSVEPGFGGQKFNDVAIQKCQYLKAKQKDYHYLISIDGGINDKTLPLVKDYVDLVVVGSFITKAKAKKEAITKLKNI